MFPQRLDSSAADDIAKAMLYGFNRHYRLFRTESVRQKYPLKIKDWRAQRTRIWSSCARCFPDERTCRWQPFAAALTSLCAGQLA